jgi:hypothetical protein
MVHFIGMKDAFSRLAKKAENHWFSMVVPDGFGTDPFVGGRRLASRHSRTGPT